MKRKTVYDILLACCALVFVLVLAGTWLNDERLAYAGLLVFTGLCLVSAVLITLNEH